MIKFTARVLGAAVCATAFALPASATPVWPNDPVSGTGPLGQQWTANWDGWDIAETDSDLVIEKNTLSYHYLGGGFFMGTPTQTYVFKTSAAKSGILSLGIDLSSNGLWDGSATSMYIWQGDTAHRTLLAGATDGAVVHQTIDLDLTAGQSWGFLAVSGSIEDDLHFTGPVWGSFTITDPATPGGDVPEPASLAILGLGALGLAAARRRKAA